MECRWPRGVTTACYCKRCNCLLRFFPSPPISALVCFTPTPLKWLVVIRDPSFLWFLEREKGGKNSLLKGSLQLWGLLLFLSPFTYPGRVPLGHITGSLDMFQEQWALSGVLCSVSPSGSLILTITPIPVFSFVVPCTHLCPRFSRSSL